MISKFYRIQCLSNLFICNKNNYNISTIRAPYLFLLGNIGHPECISYQNFMYNVSKNYEKVFYISGKEEYNQSWKDRLCQKRTKEEVDEIMNDQFSSYSNFHFLTNSPKMLENLNTLVVNGDSNYKDLFKKTHHTFFLTNSKIDYNKMKLLTENQMTIVSPIYIYNNNKKTLYSIPERNKKDYIFDIDIPFNEK